MPTEASQAGTLTCAKCGLSKPVTSFDQRFISKAGNVTCSECRGVSSESSKWQDSWAKRRATDTQWAVERAQRIAQDAARQKYVERERRQEERARRKAQLLQDYLIGRGFSTDEIELIYMVHEDIRLARQPWGEIKRRYHALTPPYTPYHPRVRTSQATRSAVYSQQGGRCFYCQRELLSLDVWKRGSRGGRSAIDAMDWNQRHNGADSGIPELDHKIPVSRGGDHQHENLCFACRKCNQLKGIRTADEFALYPSDPITNLNIQLGSVYAGIELEARGYDRFAVGLPSVRELRKLVSLVTTR